MPFLTKPTESECFEAAQKELEELRAQNDKAIFLAMLEANIKYRKWEDQNGIQKEQAENEKAASSWLKQVKQMLETIKNNCNLQTNKQTKEKI